MLCQLWAAKWETFSWLINYERRIGRHFHGWLIVRGKVGDIFMPLLIVKGKDTNNVCKSQFLKRNEGWSEDSNPRRPLTGLYNGLPLDNTDSWYVPRCEVWRNGQIFCWIFGFVQVLGMEFFWNNLCPTLSDTTSIASFICANKPHIFPSVNTQ